MDQQRNLAADCIKGAAIITVVLIHVFRGTGTTSLLIGEMGRWAVPAFFMIQGYYLVKSSNKLWMKLAVQKVRKIYAPFLVCSAAYGLYYFLIRGRTFTVSDVFMGETAVHLYFIFHYMIFALLFPLLYRTPQKVRFTCLWFMILSNFAICLILELQRTYGFSLITYSGPNPAKWWGFVALGMLLSEDKKIIDYARRKPNFVASVGAILTLAGLLVPFLTNTIGYMYNKASLFPLSIGSTIFLAVIFKNKLVKGTGFLAFVGQHSFGIYLLHLFLVHLFKYLIPNFLWIDAVLTLFVCLFILELLKIAKNKLHRLIYNVHSVRTATD